MPRSRALGLIAVLLLAATLVAAAPAAAHSPAASAGSAVGPVAAAPENVPGSAPADPAPVESSRGWLIASALLLGLGLGVSPGLRLGVERPQRRPRRVLLVALGLLLVVFAFENALHSVHHGLDEKRAGECTIAAAASHLSAVSADAPVATSVVLSVVGRADEIALTAPPARLLEPDQGRAPPLPSV